MSILIFFIVLFVLVLVHEWGHFIVAKKTGMRVDEFGIGFPPKVFSIKKGETEYSFNLFPVGGFVRIFGENAQDAKEAGEQGSDTSRSFTSKNKWAQSAVLVAGVTMNVLLAWALFAFVFMYGVPTAVEEGEATSDAELVVVSVLAGSPAAEADIPIGAQILSYSSAEGFEMLTPTEFREYTLQSGAVPMTLTYEVGKEQKTIEITPELGLIEEDAKQPALGVALALVETVRKPFFTALYDATVTTYESLMAIITGLGSLFVDIAQNDADLSQVAGPIGIVGLVGDAADFGLSSLLMFTAIISLNLAVINLLPFPALDGGRLLFVAVEAVIRRPIDPVWVYRLNAFGFFLLILLMLAVTYNDITKLI